MIQKQNDKHERFASFKRRGYGVGLRQLLPDLGEHIGSKHLRTDIALAMNWVEIIGEEFAESISLVRISRVKGSNILILACDSGSNVLIYYHSRQICERINRYFGREVVSDIRLRTRARA